MKINYNREKDILLIELNNEKIDYAEESENIILHLNKQQKPVLIEILDATEFLQKTIEVSMKTKSGKFVEV